MKPALVVFADGHTDNFEWHGDTAVLSLDDEGHLRMFDRHIARDKEGTESLVYIERPNQCQ